MVKSGCISGEKSLLLIMNSHTRIYISTISMHDFDKTYISDDLKYEYRQK